MIDTLNATQRDIIDRATADLPATLVEPFEKFLADILRAKREVADSDVRHACGAAHVRFRAKFNNGKKRQCKTISITASKPTT